jgi:hypothetical protein
MRDIVAFYQGTATDDRGRRLRDIWQWDDDQLEEVHNYIQWLFPNRDPSMFNYNAPLLDDATEAAFHADESLRRNLESSLEVMLRFYGLEYRPDSEDVVRREDFAHKAANWLHPYNHNYLRITRILKCLMALGLRKRAQAFYDCLRDIYQQLPERIGEETLAYWTEAVTKSES